MPSQIATLGYALLILGLFWLDRDQNARTSKALWLPVVWVLLAGSRSVGQWLSIGQAVSGSSPSDQQAMMEGSPIDRTVYAGLLILGLAVLYKRRVQVARLLRANGPVLLFFLYCIASILWSDYPDVAFKRWTKALGDLVMILIVLSDREPLAAAKRFFARAAFLLIPISVLIIKYYPEIGRTYSQWSWTPYYIGVALNKNHLGAICLVFGLASLWRFLIAYRDRKSDDRARHLIAHGAILAMVLWLFWLANSMTSLSCFLMGSVLLIATNLRLVIRKPLLIHFFVAALILGSIATLFFGVGAGFVKDTMTRDSSTLTDRTEVWKLALSLTPSPLLGTGFESFWLGPRLAKMWSGYRWEPTEAHNGYIEIYLNLGWTGIVLLAIVIATGYRRVITAYRRRVPLGSLMLAYFVTGLIYNITEAAFFRMMAPVWIFFLFALVSIPAPANARLRKAFPTWASSPLPDELPQVQPASLLHS